MIALNIITIKIQLCLHLNSNQKETLKAIKKEFGIKVKVLVGGAPVTKEWADKIGADGYARDAFGAAIMAKKVIKNNRSKI